MIQTYKLPAALPIRKAQELTLCIEYVGDLTLCSVKPRACGDDLIGVALHDAAPGEVVEILHMSKV